MLAGLAALAFPYPLLGTRVTPDTRGPAFREGARELGGGRVGQAIQIMFKALLLPFCGELWHSEEGGAVWADWNTEAYSCC